MAEQVTLTPQLEPWQRTALEAMNDGFTTIVRRMDMSAGPTGAGTAREGERTPQVQTQIQHLQAVVEKLQQGVTEVTKVFRPVLAEVGGEKAVAETGPLLPGGLAPLAEDLAKLVDCIEAENRRLHSLVRRCEV